MASATPKVVVAVRLEEDLVNRIEHRAATMDRTFSELVRKALAKQFPPIRGREE
jgi:predicted transcriptional regulator